MTILWTFPSWIGSSSFDLFTFLENNVLWVVIGAALLFGLYGYFTFKASQPKKTSTLSEEQIQLYVDLLGGYTNLLQAKMEGNRISFTVFSPRNANLEGLKAAGANGIFVSGNQIKLMFSFDATLLVERINNPLKEEKS